MILLPIGRDDAEIRRHAWVSYVVIALNILAFVAVETASRSSKLVELQRKWDAVGQYLTQKPYLQVPPEMEPMLTPGSRLYLNEARKATSRTGGPPARFIVEREQRRLNELASEAVAEYHKLPHIRFGYIPAESGFGDLLTSMFIHAGFLHLLGNLIFFFVSGPFVEDVFGRPLFAALYMTGGIAASLTYSVRHPDTHTALVGASGAIAAVMGAYLVRFMRSKVEFLFIPFLFRPMLHFRFFLPAFVVLPLWFVQQWWEMSGEAGGGGTAFSAHVGGFVYGFAVALIVKLTGFEEKFVNPTVVKQTTWSMDERTIAAMEAVHTAQAMEDPVMLDKAATQLLARYIEEKQNDLAIDLIQDHEHDRLPKFLARAAVFVERSGDREWALTLYQRVFESDPSGSAAVQSLVKIGTLLRVTGDVVGARETLAKARSHPACTAEWAGTIDAKLQQLSS